MKTIREYINAIEAAQAEIDEATQRRNGLALEAAEMAPVKVGDVIPVHREAYCFQGKTCRVVNVRLALDYSKRPIWKIRGIVLKADGTATNGSKGVNWEQTA